MSQDKPVLTREWLIEERKFWAEQVATKSPLDIGIRLRIATCDLALSALDRQGWNLIAAVRKETREECARVRPDLVQVTRGFLESLQCPVSGCDGSGSIRNTGPDPQDDSCSWCETRDRFLAGDVPDAAIRNLQEREEG